MSYATQQDIIDYLGSGGDVALTQMTDPDNLAIDATLVAKFLTRAYDEINPYLAAAGLTLPLTAPYPPLLTTLEVVGAVYWMWAGDERPDRLKDDRKWQIKMLDDLRDRKISLGLSGDGSEVVADTTQSPSVSANALVFTDELLATL